jgi:hypothetical protein
VRKWLAKNGSRASGLIPQDLRGTAVHVLDLSVGSNMLPGNLAER